MRPVQSSQRWPLLDITKFCDIAKRQSKAKERERPSHDFPFIYQAI